MAFRMTLALGAAVLALVAGCAVVGDRATPGATEPLAVPAVSERSLEPLPAASTHVSSAKLRRVDTVELDAEQLVLRRGDRTLAVLSMRDARATVGTLSRLLGTPERIRTDEGDGGRCLPASTTSTWGGAIRVAALADPAALGNAVEVRVLRAEVRTRDGDTVTLTGPDDVQVGADIRRRITRADPDLRESVGSHTDPAWQLLLGEGWPSDHAGAGTNGVSALTDGTRVTVIGAPMAVHADTAC